MGFFIVRRILQSLVAVVGVLFVVFILLHSSGNPVNMLLPPQASPATRAAVVHSYGLDRPIIVQYLLFLWHAIQGNFGTSFQYGRPALPVVLDHLPATLELTVASMALSVVLGFTAGIIAAIRRGSWVDQAVMFGAVLGQSMPSFWLALLMIYFFSVVIHAFPAFGYGSFNNLVMPAIALSPFLGALVARMVRTSMLEVLHQDYIRTARAKGAPGRTVIFKHALPNAIMPTLHVIGLSFAYYLGGAIVIEYVFSWPGIGNLVFGAIGYRDYPIVLTVVTLVAIGFIFINLALDILHGFIDPRVRLEQKS
jgi:peptide/nickel transport system permease protein